MLCKDICFWRLNALLEVKVTLNHKVIGGHVMGGQ
jgi:hypothetical protein